jgi:PAS domain S-box-containing protein
VKGTPILLKEAQEAILEEVRFHHLANIVRNMRDGIIVTDLDGRITHWNEGAASIHDLRAEEMLGNAVWRVYPGFDPAELAASVGKEEGNIVRREWQRTAKDGSVLWVETRMMLMRDAGGHPAGYILVERDVTERRLANEALKASEERLRQLSADLLNAQENERKSIALELHDSLAAELSAIKFRIDMKVAQMNETTQFPDRILLEDIAEMVKRTVENTRRIMANLRPSILDDLGILPTVEWFCRDFESVYSHITVEKVIQIAEREIPDSYRIAIFRVVQEAMNNVAKHSEAKKVNICLEKYKRTIRLTVRDNGKGFDPAHLERPKTALHGVGLNSMRERTESLGGSFKIESAKGSGTTIQASWPMK